MDVLYNEAENVQPSVDQIPVPERIETPSDEQIPSLDDIAEKVVYNAVELIAMGNIEPKYLMKPFLPQIGTAVLAGKPDIGKSQFARQLCIQVALGEKTFLGFELTPIHNRAIYVTTEDSKESTTVLLNAQFKGLDKEAVENIGFIFADIMEQDEIIKNLDIELKIHPADFVVIDSFGDIFLGGDANKNIAMRKTVKSFDIIAKRHNCLILFVHHINKAAYKQSPSQEQIQGGSGLVQKVRLAIILSEGEGNIRYFTVVKGNYCPKEFKQNSIELLFSEENFLFVNTGNMIPTSKLGAEPDKIKKADKNDEIKKMSEQIFSSGRLTYSDFVKILCERTGKSEATAKRVIRDLLISDFLEKKQGNYFLKSKIVDVDTAVGEELNFEAEADIDS